MAGLPEYTFDPRAYRSIGNMLKVPRYQKIGTVGDRYGDTSLTSRSAAQMLERQTV